MRNAEGKSRNVSSIPQGGRTDCVHPQKAFWIVKNDRIIDEVNHLGPRDFYNKLLARDDVAWKSVKTLVVDPIFRQPKFASMAQEKSITEGDAWGYLCLAMLKGERLEECRDPDTLKSWMQSYVRNFIQKFFTKKEKRIVSADALLALKNRAAKGGEEARVGDPFAQMPDENAEQARKRALTFDERELIQRRFHSLWKKSPLKAYVLMLKMRENLSSKEIQKICKVSTCQNVDKILERAKKDMAVALLKDLDSSLCRKKGAKRA